MRVHLGIVIHGFAGDVAQNVAKPLREEDKQRQDQHADEGQLPFEGKHDGQDRNCFDDVGDDADDGVADGVLRADHIVVEAGHQLTNLGVGEEAQTHPLQFAEERHAQIVDDAFADGGVESALDNVDPAFDERHRQQSARQQNQLIEIFIRQGMVNHLPEYQWRDEAKACGEEDRHQHPADVPPVRFGVVEHAQ